jgi:hypothetical protein
VLGDLLIDPRLPLAAAGLAGEVLDAKETQRTAATARSPC